MCGRWKLMSSGGESWRRGSDWKTPLAPKKKSKRAWNNLERRAVQGRPKPAPRQTTAARDGAFFDQVEVCCAAVAASSRQVRESNDTGMEPLARDFRTRRQSVRDFATLPRVKLPE